MSGVGSRRSGSNAMERACRFECYDVIRPRHGQGRPIATDMPVFRDPVHPPAAAITLNQFLDQWLATSAKPRLRARTFHDYESLLRLYIRPPLGTHLIGTIGQIDMQGSKRRCSGVDCQEERSSTRMRCLNQATARRSAGECWPMTPAPPSICRG